MYEFLLCLTLFSKKLWVLAQKPLGGHEGAARQHISLTQKRCFCYELPGGEIEPPGNVCCADTID